MNRTEPGAAEGPTGGQLLADRLGAKTQGVEKLRLDLDPWLIVRDPNCAACSTCAGDRELCLATCPTEAA